MAKPTPETQTHYHPQKGVPRPAYAEWLGFIANMLCILIGVTLSLCVQAALGFFDWEPPQPTHSWNMKNVVLVDLAESNSTAESIRMMMAEAGVKYEDRRLSFEEWDEVRHDVHTYPFGQLPQLQERGQVISQLAPIAKYIGKATGLTTASWDIAEEMRADEILSGVEQTWHQYKALAKLGLEDQRVKEYASVTLPMILKQLQYALATHSKKYFVANRLTYVDFLLWGAIDQQRKHLNSSMLLSFPVLNRWYKRVANLPNVKSYLRSARQAAKGSAKQAAKGTTPTTQVQPEPQPETQPEPQEQSKPHPQQHPEL